MKNTFGTSVSLTVFGESHGPAVGVVLDGIAPGVPVDEVFIAEQLSKRRPAGKISTARVEADDFDIVSGVFNGRATGTPITIIIPNKNVKSDDYSEMSRLARPGHADYTARLKYHGYEDFRGGGHFSGRVTAGIVAAGAIALSALKLRSVTIGTHIRSCAGINDREFSDVANDIDLLNALSFAVLDDKIAEAMVEAIEQAAKDGDSVGGVLETAVCGFPEGVGEPMFDTIEGVLSHALFAIPAIKGVQFGDGFAFANMRGSVANDQFDISGGKVVTKTNHAGGVNGGITNGMPILFSCAVKPTPSIFKTQDTIDYINMESAKLTLKGRHDPAIIHRARVVVDSITAIALCDLLAQRFGTDYIML